VLATFLITPLYDALRWTWHDPDGYAIISGPLADITLLGGAYALFRHHNCHVRGCPRIGRHRVDGTDYIVCRHHHPNEAPTAERVLAEHGAAMERRAQAAGQAVGGTQPSA
jgi:hypothetical protein